uniref:LIM zinc-binding domain-containing protein n=3 Tax=Triticinae TaxID=1648030 RepID=A0A452XCZ8_AEGTS
MGWLTKFFRGSTHNISEGREQSKPAEETRWNEPSTSTVVIDPLSEFDNEDIDRAIALSLLEEEHRKPKETGKDLHLDEDEQLARAIQESLNVESPPRPHENASPPRPRENSAHPRARENGNANGGNSYQQLPFMFSSGFRTCAGCHNEIGHGRFLSCMGAVWHPECFCCHACNQPIYDYEFSMSGNHPYHKTCYKERFHPKCDVCKQFIPTNMNGLIEYRAHPFWLQKYCPSHEVDGTPRCCSCERMEEFYEGLNMKVEQQVPLLLVERQALNEAMEGEKTGHHHLPETRGLCLSEEQTVSTILRRPRMTGNKIMEMITEPYRLTRRCEVTAILILYGLPRLLTGSILAHEMMHAWLRLKGYRTLTPDIEEGICQVLAHLWIESEIMAGSGSNAASTSSSSSSSTSSKKGGRSQFERKLGDFFKHQIESDTSVAYGDGFRAGNRVVQQYGLKRTLEHIRLTGTLPF